MLFYPVFFDIKDKQRSLAYPFAVIMQSFRVLLLPTKIRCIISFYEIAEPLAKS